MRYTGAQLIVRLLEQQGITLVSGIPGGAALPLYDALGKAVLFVMYWHDMSKVRVYGSGNGPSNR